MESAIVLAFVVIVGLGWAIIGSGKDACREQVRANIRGRGGYVDRRTGERSDSPRIYDEDNCPRGCSGNGAYAWGRRGSEYQDTQYGSMTKGEYRTAHETYTSERFGNGVGEQTWETPYAPSWQTEGAAAPAWQVENQPEWAGVEAPIPCPVEWLEKN